ncbi:hypothetical protein [Actinopolyspora xinjiangensis]|nr:hypothetical protein [Actinopolyspora xinjiangensis]
MWEGIDLPVRIVEADEPGHRRGRVVLDGRPVDIALRFFTIDDVVDDERWSHSGT